MTIILDLLKTFKLDKIKLYLLAGALFLLLIVENLFGLDVPLFSVPDEFVGSYVLALLAIVGLGIKTDTNAANADENALAAIAIATGIKLEDLKALIQGMKDYAAAVEKKEA